MGGVCTHVGRQRKSNINCSSLRKHVGSREQKKHGSIKIKSRHVMFAVLKACVRVCVCVGMLVNIRDTLTIAAAVAAAGAAIIFRVPYLFAMALSHVHSYHAPTLSLSLIN